jgi:hypothetical protein
MSKRLTQLLGVVALGLFLTALTATPALAQFGFEKLDFRFTNADGSVATQAGAHPFAVTNTLDFNTTIDPLHGEAPDELVKDIRVSLPEGLVGDPTAVPRCSNADFVDVDQELKLPHCSNASAVGTIIIKLSVGGADPEYLSLPVYNLIPPPGVVQKLGFIVYGVPIVIEFTLNPDPPYNIIASVNNTPEPLPLYRSELSVWGNPADPVHDSERGNCIVATFFSKDSKIHTTGQSCPASIAPAPFITVPRACEGPLPTIYEANSWQNPGVFAKGSILTHDDFEPPNPEGMTGCSKLGFSPSIAAQPTTKAASSPTGLDFALNVEDEGLTSSSGLAQSDIKKSVVTLPEGFSVNPSIAEGLEVCTEADLARETAFSEAGAGCPNASKIGSVEVETPLLDENVNGALYQAAPYENPFDSLIALYIVIKNPTLGLVVRQPLRVIPDPLTGRLTTVAEDMPQLPFSHFRLHFREGARSPLASPPKCGTYNAEADLYPWAGGTPVHTTSAFQIITGPDAGPCASGGLPPFKPGLIAGSINNAAGRFSPFNIRLFRSDSEQEITHFSIKLPPGITAKLAGVPYCSNAQIANAIARKGPHGGQEELEDPSCPAGSEIGHTLVGGGVGSALAYAPGKVYLAGPYNGSNLSIVAITAGIVGPFDIGTVVVREALKIDPETAEAFIDATGSDPIPHIIKGVPVHLRDVRVYTDRPNFVLNPTDCSRTSTASTVLGSGLDFGSEADDRPITVSTPYQAADCAALPFKPKLSLKLKGGTRRGAHPAFTAKLKMNGIGEAGIARAEVTLPKSEFIENAHFQTICTRIQFKAGAGNGTQCPAKSIYGKARAITPILGEPLTGPVFLRSSEHQLPDLVVALHNSQVDFDLVGRVDSVKGRLRSTFETTPDAPVTSFVLEMKGGSKGLFVNSTNLCKATHRVEANFDGQNGKSWNKKPELVPTGCKAKGRKGKKHGNAR